MFNPIRHYRNRKLAQAASKQLGPDLPEFTPSWPDAAVALYIRLDLAAAGSRTADALDAETRSQWKDYRVRVRKLSIRDRLAVAWFRVEYQQAMDTYVASL